MVLVTSNFDLYTTERLSYRPIQCSSFPQVGSSAVEATGGGGGVQSLLSKLKAGARAEERGEDNPGLLNKDQGSKYEGLSEALRKKAKLIDKNDKKRASAGIAGAFLKKSNLAEQNGKLGVNADLAELTGKQNNLASVIVDQNESTTCLGLNPRQSALSAIAGVAPKQTTSLTTTEQLLQGQVLSAI